MQWKYEPQDPTLFVPIVTGTKASIIYVYAPLFFVFQRVSEWVVTDGVLDAPGACPVLWNRS
jgi:hypothetical protein